MLPTWNDALTPDQNLEALAYSLEQSARNLSQSPSRSAARDELELRARAARLGQFLCDPRDIRGCDPQVQKWRARCDAAGRTVQTRPILAHRRRT